MAVDQGCELLVVDDESELRELLDEYFNRHGFHVRTALDAATARDLVAERPPRLAIVDVHMPGEDGLSLTRWLREQHPQMGIVMLTAAAETIDRVVGLEVGADDYVPKPFELRELLARVKSLLRRLGQTPSAAPAPSTLQRVVFGQCVLELTERRLIAADGTDVAISAADFDLLTLFARHPNRPLSRDQIMAQAHNRMWEAFDRSVDLRILRLRRKIEANPNKPEVIKTVRNIGYVFVCKDLRHDA
jgi:two-component system phosphate regulon response regulator OmpR